MEFTVGRIALALKPHRQEIVKADEWRPLAKHVIDITRRRENEIRREVLRSLFERVDKMARAGDTPADIHNHIRCCLAELEAEDGD